MKTVNLTVKKNKVNIDCDSTEILPAYFYYLLMVHNINPHKAKINFNDQTVKLKKIDGEYIFERI